MLEIFFNSWITTTKLRQDIIIENWNYESQLSSVIMYDDQSVLSEISKQLNLNVYFEYYKLDAILFKNSDRVSVAPSSQTWISSIQIAFEHENYINSGLFQEASHLMITDCNLAVLVTYPNYENEINREIKILHKLIQESLIGKETISSKNFLLIFGWKIKRNVYWVGCEFKENDWGIVNPNCEVFNCENGLSKETFSIKD